MKNLNTLKIRCLQNEGRKLFTRLNAYLEGAAETCAEPDIHQMRVAVKKWRALLALTKHFNKGNKQKKFSKRYKKIFSTAGIIRDAQVHALFLNDHHLTAQMQPYLNGLKEEEEKNKLLFKAQYKTLKKKASANTQLKQLYAMLNRITPAGIAAYSAGCAKQTAQLITLSYSDELQLHQLRKLLKQWQYNILLLQNCGYEQVNGKALIAFLLPFNELLGKWQDSAVAIDYLNELQNGQMIGMDSATFAKLYSDISGVKAVFQRQVMAKLLDLSVMLAKME